MHKGLSSAGKRNPNPSPKTEPKKWDFFYLPEFPDGKSPPAQADPAAFFFFRKMPQNGLPAAAAPMEPKDRGVKSGSFGPKRLENDGSSRRGLKFPPKKVPPKRSSPKIGDFLELGWGWIRPFCYWCLLGKPPPAPNSPLLVLRTKPTPKSDPETPPWNEIRHFRPLKAGGGIWSGEKKKKRGKKFQIDP